MSSNTACMHAYTHAFAHTHTRARAHARVQARTRTHTFIEVDETHLVPEYSELACCVLWNTPGHTEALG